MPLLASAGDYLLIAAMGIGLIALYFTLNKGGTGAGCAGASANCVYNKCKRDYCWRGFIGPNLAQVCIQNLVITANPNYTPDVGCSVVRERFLYCAAHKTDPTCHLTYVQGGV